MNQLDERMVELVGQVSVEISISNIPTLYLPTLGT